MDEIIIILDNIRSAHNVGSIIRTAAGFGVKEIYALGQTPYLQVDHDPRLPHVAKRATNQITKTSLGGEKFVVLKPASENNVLPQLKARGFRIIALENIKGSTDLTEYSRSGKLALILGNEIQGISPSLLDSSDDIVGIPMTKYKESFNVSVAAAIALYHFLSRA